MARLLAAAQAQFICLQAAWDSGDMVTLGALTTPQMLDDLCTQRLCLTSSGNHTDVISLEARLLGFEDLGSAWLATVEFTGMICESPQCGAAPFRELWLLTRSRALDDSADDSAECAWRLARQQALL